MNEKVLRNIKRKEQDSVSKKSASKMHTNSVNPLNEKTNNSELA